MAEGIFTIDELMPDGQEIRRFTWTADSTPADRAVGGARACPTKPWQMPGKVRTKRTDYPGSDGSPSEQVLGTNREPFTLKGRWDDRYNFAGYAVQEQRRFEEMVMRANRVRLQYNSQTFIGIITSWDTPYLIEWYIRYEFTVSVHRRGDVSALNDFQSAVPKTIPPLGASVDKIESFALAMEEVDAARPQHLIGEIGDTVSSRLADVSTGLGKLQATLDNTQLDAIVDNAIGPFRRIATQMRSIRGAAIDTSQSLSDIRADTELATKDAINALTFEVWSRGLRENGRRLSAASYQAALDAEERDTPAAETYYRPRAGESLYRIAIQFFGTADAWRLIAERNNLRVLTLTGEELLVIPEGGRI